MKIVDKLKIAVNPIISKIHILSDKTNHLMKYFYICIVSLLIISIALQAVMFGIDKKFWESLLPNIIISLLDLIVTTFIIKIIIEKQQENKMKDIVRDVLKNSYIPFLNYISYRLIVLITGKTSVTINGNKENFSEALARVLNQIDSLVDNNICIRKYDIITELDSSYHEIHVELSYKEFMYNFKKQVKNEIKDFLTMYVSILPNEVVQSIAKINDLLDSGILITGTENEFIINFENTAFNSEALKQVLNDIGKELIYLYDYAKPLRR